MVVYGPEDASPTAIVPVISPVLGLKLSPGGRPISLMLRPVLGVWVMESETLAPSALVWVPGFVRVTGLLTVAVLLPFTIKYRSIMRHQTSQEKSLDDRPIPPYHDISHS